MTTLPQAAALRLPRPAFSNLPVADVPVGGAIGYPQQSCASAMTGADVWRVIRSNLWLIILLLIVSAAAGYGMNFWLLKYHPRYTAQGKVLVLGTVEDTAAGMLRESSSLDSFSLPMEVRLHTAMLKDSLLFTKVLQNPNTITQTIGMHMTSPCKFVLGDALVVDAQQLMHEKRVNALPVVDNDMRVLGLFDIQDLV